MHAPTVGRKVWYRPSQQDKDGTTGDSPATGKMETNGDEPIDATVVAVWGDRLVNLSITDIYGTKHARRSVTLVQEGDPVPVLGRFAEWMPYQSKQHAKDKDAEFTQWARAAVGHTQD